MAALYVQHSPHAADLAPGMASRRVPLRDASNSRINSPLRAASTAIVGQKRSRAHNADQRELAYPVKKQAVEVEYEPVSRPTNGLQHSGLPRRAASAKTDLQKRLEAARTADKNKATQEDNIRQWQRHYRKVFPTITFYFESIPDELRSRLSSQVRSLGAREEIFFSKEITHVVTTRPIPSESHTTSSNTGRSPKQDHGSGKTINPLLLENQNRGKFTFEVPGKKMQANDTLLKAKEYGMKIWSVEKLQRMLNTLLNVDPTDPTPTFTTATTVRTKTREAELSQMLRNERRHANVDRDWMAEMVSFRGYFIYVHDMDEKTKPVMIRDYPKVERRDQGKWPQLRIAAAGRCPFLDDPPPRRTVTEPTRPAAEQVPRRTRAATAALTGSKESQALEEITHNAVRPNPDSPAKPLGPPKDIPVKKGSTDHLPLFGSAQISLRKVPRFAQGEPVASGVQPSNVTSAIRSQQVSSTAAIPGAKAGTSKEFNALKRKVLERNGNNATADFGNNVRAALNANSNDDHGRVASRAHKRKALDNIVEDDEEASRVHARPAPRKKRVVERDPKPGYCENCRDKYEDFDEHIQSRQHRRFALSNENFKELDQLLAKLERQ